MAKRIKFKATISILVDDNTSHVPYVDTVAAFLNGYTAGFGRTAEATKTVCRMDPGEFTVTFKYDIEADPPLPPWDDEPKPTKVKKPARRAKESDHE